MKKLNVLIGTVLMKALEAPALPLPTRLFVRRTKYTPPEHVGIVGLEMSRTHPENGAYMVIACGGARDLSARRN